MSMRCHGPFSGRDILWCMLLNTLLGALIACTAGDKALDTASTSSTPGASDSGLTDTATTPEPDDTGARPAIEDRDGDGYGASVDCDDANSGINPGTPDICGDGLDQNCSGADALCALKLVGAAEGDSAGRSVAAAGDVNGDGSADFIVGAHRAGASEGAAFVFLGPLDGAPGLGEADATLRGDHLDGWLGASVAGAGDVDGDGYDDLIIGAYGEDASGLGFYVEGGAAYLLAGGPELGGELGYADAAAQVKVEDYGVWLGHAVAGAGDGDGDGLDDVLIGAPRYSHGGSETAPIEEGLVLWLPGPVSGSASLDALREREGVGWIEGAGQLGYAVAGVGDVDGDGLEDVLIGAPAPVEAGDPGRALLFLGPLDGAPEADASFAGTVGNGRVGGVLAAGGDVDGDGSPDLLIGSLNANQVALFTTWAPGEQAFDAAAAVVLGTPGDQLGASLAGAGDLDVDGLGEVLIGAPAMGLGGEGSGGAWLLYGPLEGALGPADAGRLLEPDAAGILLGMSVAGVGDLDGDGLPDLAVGAPGDDEGGDSSGALLLFPGASL